MVVTPEGIVILVIPVQLFGGVYILSTKPISKSFIVLENVTFLGTTYPLFRDFLNELFTVFLSFELNDIGALCIIFPVARAFLLAK